VTQYDTLLMTARIKQLSLIDTQIKLLDKTLKVAYQDIDKLLNDMAVTSTDTIKPARLTALKKELDVIIDNTIDTTRDFVVKGISDGVQIGTDGHTRAGMALMYDIAPDVAQKIPRAFAMLNMDAVRVVLSRTYDDNKAFSDRIWDLRNHSKTVISETVARGVIRGQSARNMSMALRQYLTGYRELMEGIPEEDTVTRKKLMRGRGDLRYNATRLARTEINNAFREATVLSASKAPWVEGVKWNLSNSHPKVDICDTYASRDLYGMGAGVYPPMDTPRDHPNGLCFLTDKLISDERMMAMIRSGEMENLLSKN
jgi:hypothetical protein